MLDVHDAQLALAYTALLLPRLLLRLHCTRNSRQVVLHPGTFWAAIFIIMQVVTVRLRHSTNMASSKVVVGALAIVAMTVSCDAAETTEGARILLANAAKEGVVVLPSGLQYKASKETCMLANTHTHTHAFQNTASCAANQSSALDTTKDH
jgi:hypothetical protein